MPTTEKLLSSREALAFSAELEESGRLEEAEKVLRAILQADPRNHHAYNRLGAVLFNRGDRFQALYCFERALKIDRRYSAALSNRGMLLGELGHIEEAEADLRISTHLDPKNPVGWNSLSNTLERAGKLTEALGAVDRALAIDPKHALSQFNRGTIIGRLGNHDAAVAAFDATLELLPDFADAHFNRAMGYLNLGDYERGFREYEWRFKSTEKIYVSPSTAPRWDGDASLIDKTILLWGEQGIGDSIQFLRYVDDVIVEAPGGRVLLYVHGVLRSMCRAHWGDAVDVLESDKDLPPHDFQMPLMSLPVVFPQIPAPWRPSEPSGGCPDCNRWGGIIGDNLSRAPVLRVGLCWAGNPNHRNDRNRSIALETFRSIVGIPGVVFYSLQKDATAPADRQGADMVALAHHFTDMRQAAHAIGWLDIVITVDTAIAHLAASLGTETWVLVPEVSDWRWAQERSRWYPEATIFRRTGGDWAATIREVRRRLEARGRQAAA